MSDTDDPEIRGIDMTREEIDDLLTDRGYGTLALSAEGRAYAVPISVGYDGDRLFLNLITFGEVSKKAEFLRQTEEACLVVTAVDDRFDWRSVVVTGTIEPVPPDEEEYHRAILDENAWFPVIYPPSEPLTERTRVVMDPTEMTGRKGEAHQG